jgi:hypothetical protein
MLFVFFWFLYGYIVTLKLCISFLLHCCSARDMVVVGIDPTAFAYQMAY